MGKVCPHCGGEDGFTYKLRMTYTMNGAWGEDAQTTGEEFFRRPKTVSCIDCNKRVKLEEANGYNGDS